MATEFENIKAQHHAKRTRLLEVDAELAEASRAYFADGISIPRASRAGLMAESKRLQLEIHRLNFAMKEAKLAALAFNRTSVLNLLIEKCTAAGHQALVEAARAESLEALEGAGMLEAYKS